MIKIDMITITRIKRQTTLSFLLTALCVFAPLRLYAQDATFPTQPINTQVLALTATTANTAWANLSGADWRDAHYFTLTWYAFDSVPACSVKAQQTADQSVLSDLITSQDCTVSGVTTTSSGLAPGSNYIRISLGTKTGAGKVLVLLTGYRQDPYGSVATGGGGLPANAATASNQTDGSQKTQVYYGGTTTPILPTDVAPVNIRAAATNGTTGCLILSAASTNAQSCGTAPTAWYGGRIFNTTTTVYYLRRYNTAGTPTCSSATGFIDAIPIPPASAAGSVGGFIQSLTVGETATFTTGLGWCITGGSSSTDNTNAAVGIFGEIYKKQ